MGGRSTRWRSKGGPGVSACSGGASSRCVALGARGGWSHLAKQAAHGAGDPWTIVDDTEFIVGMCHVCLSRQDGDGCAWADRDDCELPVQGVVVVLRAAYPGCGLGRDAWADG